MLHRLFDLVLFTVKLWDTEMAGEQTCPLLGPNTRVMTLQNGVDSVDRLVPILGEEATIAGTTYMVILAGERSSPGRPGLCTKPAGPCATCSYWPGIDRSKLRSDTSTAIPTPNASSFH